MYAVVINEGPLLAEDNATLFCKEQPTFSAVPVPVENDEDSMKYIVFVVFTPTNGPRKGTEMRVLKERVVSISSDPSGWTVAIP